MDGTKNKIINKRFVHFKNYSTFLKEINNETDYVEDKLLYGNIKRSSIVYISDKQLIWTHGKFYPLFNLKGINDLVLPDDLTLLESDGLLVALAKLQKRSDKLQGSIDDIHDWINSAKFYDRLDSWDDYSDDKAGWVLSALLGNELYNRILALEDKNYLEDLNLVQTGSGNAVTDISISSDKKTITATKGNTFLAHTPLNGGLQPMADGNWGNTTGSTVAAWGSGISAFKFKKDNPTAGKISLLIDGTIYINEGQEPVASQNWINDSFVTLNTAQTVTGLKYFTAGIGLNTDTSWADVDRSIPFGVTDNAAIIKWYNTDANKGFTYNPSTGAVKAGSFVKRGGTSSQFLKADGSVDNNSYSTTSHTHTFASITEKPTTLVGYGITDAMRFEPGPNYVGASFLNPSFSKTATEKYIELWDNPENSGATSGNGWYNLMAGKYMVNGGTSSQFLKADGSLDSNSYALASSLINYVTLNTPQTITAEKTFNYIVKYNSLLMFKHPDASTGVYFSPNGSGSLNIYLHSNYAWAADLGSISTTGALIMKSFVKQGGTSSQFLKADGSVDSNSYATSSDITSSLSNYYTKTESNDMFSPKVAYNYDQGCLVRLKAPAQYNTMVTVLIEGNSYQTGQPPIKSIVQFYNYAGENIILQPAAVHYGYNFGDIKAFNYDGRIYIWFKQNRDYQTFAVTSINSVFDNSGVNGIDSITNAAMPTSGVTRLVTITPSQGLRSDNYTSILDSRYYTETEADGRFARLASPNNLVHNANEITTVPSAFSGDLWFNYRTIGGADGNISNYMIGNGAAGYASVKAKGFIKNGSSDNYILLGGGGHMPLSDITGAYVTALGTSGNYLTWTKNGVVNNITVPHAVKTRLLEEAYGLQREDYDSLIEKPNELPCGLRFKFKSYVGAGISSAESYWNGILDIGNYAPYSSVDGGAGFRNQLRFSASVDHSDGTFWVRNGHGNTWNAWRKVLTDANYASILDTRYVKKSGDTMTGALTVPRININAAGSDAHFTAGNAFSFYASVGGKVLGIWNASEMSYRASTDYNGQVYLGSALARWANVYATTINVTSTNLVSNLNADRLDGFHASEFSRGGQAEYQADEASGNRWIRIATFSQYVCSGIISIENTWSNNENAALIFTFSAGYRGNDKYSITQIGGTNARFSKARIVYPTATNEPGFIEVYYNASTNPNTLYVRLTNAINTTLLQSATAGSIPSTHAAYEQSFINNGMSAFMLKADQGIQIGNTADFGWYVNTSNRICAGLGTARNVNVGNLLVSTAWDDQTLVPANGIYSRGVIRSGVTTGTAPFIVNSTTTVANLNADLLDGYHGSDYFKRSGQFVSGADALQQFGLGVYLNATGNGSGNTNFPEDYGVLSIFSAGTSNYTLRLHAGMSKQLKYQIKFDDVNSEWMTLARVTDNVASATKLNDNGYYTAWGQTFFANGRPQVIRDQSLTLFNTSPSVGGWARQVHIVDSNKNSLGAFGFVGGAEELDYAYIGPTYNSPWVVVKPTGLVGIGTSAPGYKLDVSGQIRANVSNGTAPFLTPSSTLCTNLNADMLDGKHASEFALLSDIPDVSDASTLNGYSVDVANGGIALNIDFPEAAELVRLGYNTSANQNDTFEYLKGICKWAIDRYTHSDKINLCGTASPNSKGYMHLQLYGTQGKNSTTKLPTYCSGVYYAFDGKVWPFHTYNGQWSLGGIFEGSASKWTTARSISITDWTHSNTGVASSIDGSSNTVIALPQNITADIIGNANTASSLETTRYIWGQPFDGTSDITGNLTNVHDIQSTGIIYAPVIQAGNNILLGSQPTATITSQQGYVIMPYVRATDLESSFISVHDLTITDSDDANILNVKEFSIQDIPTVHFSANNRVISMEPMIIVKEGICLYPTEDGLIYGIDSTGSGTFWEIRLQNGLMSATIGVEGSELIASINGTKYKLSKTPI